MKNTRSCKLFTRLHIPLQLSIIYKPLQKYGVVFQRNMGKEPKGPYIPYTTMDLALSFLRRSALAFIFDLLVSVISRRNAHHLMRRLQYIIHISKCYLSPISNLLRV